MCCKNCDWWVNEDEQGNYEHSEAVKQNKGFCIVQDLFTYKECKDECDCGEFNHE
jgi:hypothetical protein